MMKKRYLFGFILLPLSIVLLAILSPIALIYTILRSIYRVSLIEFYFIFGRLFYFIAFSIDQLGNVLCQYLFNDTLIKGNNKFKFGNPDLTISAILGENKRLGTLTKLGIFVCAVLNFIDKNHVEKAANEEIWHKNY